MSNSHEPVFAEALPYIFTEGLYLLKSEREVLSETSQLPLLEQSESLSELQAEILVHAQTAIIASTEGIKPELNAGIYSSPAYPERPAKLLEPVLITSTPSLPSTPALPAATEVLSQYKPVTVPQSQAIPAKAAAMPAAPQLLYTGGYAKKVLVLLPSKPSPAEHEFLLKVLAAVERGLPDVAVLSLSENPGFTPESLHAVLQPIQMLCFGTPALPKTETKEAYRPFIYEKSKVIQAGPLSVTEAERNLKRALWEGMKLIF